LGLGTREGKSICNLKLQIGNRKDWLGTERVRSFTSGLHAGQQCETITSLPFGDGMNTQQVNGGCGDPSPNHFTGLERDAESGLDHTLHRQYPSNLGRWLTPDPAGKDAVKRVATTRFVCRGFLGHRSGNICSCHMSTVCGPPTGYSLSP
jgi:RHS repeat-associated protein